MSFNSKSQDREEKKGFHALRIFWKGNFLKGSFFYNWILLAWKCKLVKKGELYPITISWHVYVQYHTFLIVCLLKAIKWEKLYWKLIKYAFLRPLTKIYDHFITDRHNHANFSPKWKKINFIFPLYDWYLTYTISLQVVSKICTICR